MKDKDAGRKSEARRLLIERNLRLVAHIARKYGSADEDMEDLISVGTIGLIKAVETFDPDKKIRLASYAARCIDNELLMLLRSRKKISREVSLFEPIGTDREETRSACWTWWSRSSRIWWRKWRKNAVWEHFPA
ncbi:MAG: sigma-70 family RNA polymerase sigma factor [Eisenbergiella sp.]